MRNHEPVKTSIGLKKAASPEPVHQATETEDDDEEGSDHIDDEPGRICEDVACVGEDGWVENVGG